MNTRRQFDEKLRELSAELIKMGTTAENAVSSAVEALCREDRELARRVIDGDNRIDEMERDIEQRCFKLILQQQPVAGDLRRVSSAMKMITDIERIGDAGSDIAEISLHLPNGALGRLREEVARMAEAACAMARSSIDAYVREDLSLAERTIAEDDLVDDLFLRIRAVLADKIKSDPACMDQAMDYLMIIKYLERVGDHAVNICEWVRYYLTGVHQSEGIS